MISAALKTPLEIRVGICMYKRYFCIDPMPILVSHQAVPLHFTTKLRPCTRWCDAIRNWLPFQLTWTLWASALLPSLRYFSVTLIGLLCASDSLSESFLSQWRDTLHPQQLMLLTCQDSERVHLVTVANNCKFLNVLKRFRSDNFQNKDFRTTLGLSMDMKYEC